MSEFQKGDRVRIAKPPCYWRQHLGSEGVIAEVFCVDPGQAQYRIGGTPLWLRADEIEPVEAVSGA